MNMRFISKLTRNISVVFLATGFLVACSDDDDTVAPTQPPVGNSIEDFVEDNADYSTLDQALEITGLDETLDQNGTFTVFAPNNDAFSAFLLENGFENLNAIPTETLKRYLLNHVLGSELNSGSITSGYVSTLATKEGTDANLSLLVNTDNGVMLNGFSTVTTADIETDNGIIHAVDKVIPLPTLATFAANDSNLSTLLTALTDENNTTDFVGVAANTATDLTVFAPTNAAFESFLTEAGIGLGDVSGAALDNLLRNHILLNAAVMAADIENGYVKTEATFADTSNKLSLYLNTDNGVMLNGNATVEEADIIAINGVMHKVSAVVDLPKVTTFATADPTFEVLETALTREEDYTFIETLSTPNGTSPAPFTVFAPTNDAFAHLLAELEVNDLNAIDAATLAATLNMHVMAENNITAEDLSNGPLTTLGGAVSIDADAGTITDANGRTSTIIVTDVQAANGVVHAIDKVLLPE